MCPICSTCYMCYMYATHVWFQIPRIPGLFYSSEGLAYENGNPLFGYSLPDWGTWWGKSVCLNS